MDLDRDGGLVIISRSLAGDFDVYTNTIQDGRTITFEFRNPAGNHFAIGNRSKLYCVDGNNRHQMR